jgi:hypothetical protein
MAPDAPSRKTRQQIEDELMEVLRERWREWEAASEENREIARQRFLDALEGSTASFCTASCPENRVPPRGAGAVGSAGAPAHQLFPCAVVPGEAHEFVSMFRPVGSRYRSKS